MWETVVYQCEIILKLILSMGVEGECNIETILRFYLCSSLISFEHTIDTKGAKKVYIFLKKKKLY